MSDSITMGGEAAKVEVQNCTSEATQFLTTLFLPGDAVLVRPVETWTEDEQRKSRTDYRGTYRLTVDDLTRDENWLQIIADRSAQEMTNTFFGVCPRVAGQPGETFDLAWQIRTVRCVWSDVDHCDPDEVVTRCDAANLPEPSIVVSSGHGAHLYWLLDTPYLIDDAPPPAAVRTEFVVIDERKKPIPYFINEAGERVNLKDPGTGRSLPKAAPALSPKGEHVQNIIQGVAHAIGGDDTQDLPRLLRLPGTMNRKNERNGTAPLPCRLLKCRGDIRYPLETFAAFRPPERKKRPKASGRGGTPGSTLERLVQKCIAASDRSKADYALCAEAIRRGWDMELVWSRVQTESKFADRGRDYFEQTWEAAGGTAEPELPADVVTNGKIIEIVEDAGEIKKVLAPLSMDEIITTTNAQTEDWPRRVDNVLFVHDRQHGIAWLEKPASLFGYLHRAVGKVKWHKGDCMVTRPELFAEYQRTATRYIAVEDMPHEPAIEGHYYACQKVEPGDGTALRDLLDRFNPSSDLDRDLIQAALMTPLWGGPFGSRPCFAITSDHGRGAGKTTVVEKIGAVYGGVLQFSHNEDINKIKTRLLSPSALPRRVALLDNVKSLRFSWAELEGMITASTIGGHRMFCGEATRPNTLTWFITLNGAALSTDMAQRSVIIKLDRPRRSADWDEDISEFIGDNRQRILADIVAALRADKHPLPRFTRWATWEREILQRLPEPSDAQRLILERQSVVDVEGEEAEIVQEFIAERLDRLGYDAETERVFIPSQTVALWYGWAMNEKYGVGAACRVVNQLMTEGRLPRLTPNKCNTWGRGVVWWGVSATGASPIALDLADRLKMTPEAQTR